MASIEVIDAVEHSSLAPEDFDPRLEICETNALHEFYGPLLDCEKVLDGGHGCYLSLPFLQRRVLGQTFFTNYKILFVPTKSDPQYVQLEPELNDMFDMVTKIPMLSIALVRPVDSRTSKACASPLSFDAEIVTKDVRLVRYHFGTEGERTAFLTRVHRSAFFGASLLSNSSIAFEHFFKQGESASSPSSWLYSAESEFDRLKTRLAGQNFTLFDQGPDHEMFPTYPRHIIVPSCADKTLMSEVGLFRSKQRVPAVVWIHPTNGTSLSRCSQPKSGLSSYSDPDQQLMKAIWSANPNYVETVENEATTQSPVMLIMDARSRAAATANIVVGGGYEGTRGYGRCKLEFAGIANIHAVRDSFFQLSSLCVEDKITEKNDVASTHWYHHLATILNGAQNMILALESGASVMTHCSDGWDRTSQLTSIIQLVLDPYYRTASGFAKLIQKEWLSFGHKFCERMAFGEQFAPGSEASPVFLQFMDIVAAMIRGYPTYFEFSEHFLIRLIDMIHSGLYGDFLANCQAQYLKHYALKTASIWTQLEAEWATGSLKNTHHKPQSGPMRLEAIIQSLDLWGAFFHRYNTQYLEQLKQKRAVFYENHRTLLSASLLTGDPSVENNVWRRVFAAAENSDVVLSREVRSQIGYLFELMNSASPDCLVRLQFQGDDVVQMVVQQTSGYRTKRSVPSLKDVTMDYYVPKAASSHPPSGVVELTASMSTTSEGAKNYHSKVISSSYRAMMDTMASWGWALWNSLPAWTSPTSFFASSSSSVPGTPSGSLSPSNDRKICVNDSTSSSHRGTSSAPASTTSSTQIPISVSTESITDDTSSSKDESMLEPTHSSPHSSPSSHRAVNIDSPSPSESVSISSDLPSPSQQINISSDLSTATTVEE